MEEENERKRWSPPHNRLESCRSRKQQRVYEPLLSCIRHRYGPSSSMGWTTDPFSLSPYLFLLSLVVRVRERKRMCIYKRRQMKIESHSHSSLSKTSFHLLYLKKRGINIIISILYSSFTFLYPSLSLSLYSLHSLTYCCCRYKSIKSERVKSKNSLRIIIQLYFLSLSLSVFILIPRLNHLLYLLPTSLFPKKVRGKEKI